MGLPVNRKEGPSMEPQAVIRQGRHVVANGIRQHYIRVGSGKRPMLLLPGITSPAATWEFVAIELAASSDVHVLDIRGRGLSQQGAHLQYRLDDCAEDAADLLRRLDLAGADVLGHSMGARIAVRLARRFPELVGRLVLVDPPVSGPGRRPYPIGLQYYLDSIAAVSDGRGYEEMKRSLPWAEEHLQVRMEWLPTCDPFAVAESHRSFHEEDMHADLPGILARTLLLHAEHGGTVSDADAAEIAAAIPACTALRVDGAGHMIPWDRLDFFVRAVREFLTE